MRRSQRRSTRARLAAIIRKVYRQSVPRAAAVDSLFLTLVWLLCGSWETFFIVLCALVARDRARGKS